MDEATDFAGAHDDAIELAPMRRAVHIGAGAAERRIAQIVRLEFRITGDFAAARRGDRLRDAIDYAQVHAALEAPLARGYVLLEHFADALARTVTGFRGVRAVRVRVCKERLFGETAAAVTVHARPPARTAIGLGGNIGAPIPTLAAAVARLAEIGDDLVVSSLYLSPPWGVTEQPDFYNAAALLTTNLMPTALLRALRTIEAELGRVKSVRYGPRALDLDILDDDAATSLSPELTIPHARLAERAFALVPLAEIDPRYAPLRDALPDAERARVRRLAGWPAWGANPHPGNDSA